MLTSLLALPPYAAAQAPNANPAAAAQAPNLTPAPVESLQIFILDGRGAVRDVRVRAAAMLVVEVRDENALPVEGADVTFDLPAVGPGGTFAGQQTTFTAKTNFQGQAAANFVPNLQTGRYNIRVTARSGNRAGRAVIPQTNALRAGVSEPKSGGVFKFAWWKVAVLAGAGATVGILLARRGSSGPSVTLIPGAPTFGAP